MELKRSHQHGQPVSSHLLIVPYGIETISEDFCFRTGRNLLIVPYGIETLEPATGFR